MEKGMAGERTNGEGVEPVEDATSRPPTEISVPGLDAASPNGIESDRMPAVAPPAGTVSSRPAEMRASTAQTGPAPDAPAAPAAPSAGPAELATTPTATTPDVHPPAAVAPFGAPAPTVSDATWVELGTEDMSGIQDEMLDKGSGTEPTPAVPGGLQTAPPMPPAIVPEKTPTGVRKYVYIKGRGRVRWNRLSLDEQEDYIRQQADRTKGEAEQRRKKQDRPEAGAEPTDSTGIDEIIT